NRQIHPIRVHPDVAHTQRQIARQFTFNRQVPLRRLWVAVVGRRVLIEIGRADELPRRRRVEGRRESVARGAGHRIGVRIGADDGAGDVRDIERQLSQVGHREDAKTPADDGPAVLERAVSEAEARLQVAIVNLAQSLRQTGFTCPCDRYALEVRIESLPVRSRAAGVDRTQEFGARIQLVGNDHPAVGVYERAEIAILIGERRHNRVAQAEADRQFVIDAPFILRVHRILSGRGVNVRAGLRDISESRQPQQEIGEGVTAELTGAEDELAEVVRAAETLQVKITEAADVNAEAHRVPAFDPGQVVGELRGRRARDASLVTADGREASAVAEIEDWKRVVLRVIADVQTDDVESGERISAFDRERHL